MIVKITPPYQIEFDRSISLCDHLDGFDDLGNNWILDKLSEMALTQGIRPAVKYHQILPDHIQKKYPELDLRFDSEQQYDLNFKMFEQVKDCPDLDFKNFVVTFLGSPHVGRKFLCAALARQKWLNLEYSKKNFSFSIEELDGAISESASSDMEPVYHNWLVDKEIALFFSENQHGEFDRERPWIEKLQDLLPNLTGSFVHIVSETLPTSSVPFVTEKFLHSIVTKGLFVSYAQPGWHQHIKQCYGFKLYDRIFDYTFDLIRCPLSRLKALVGALSVYSNLSQSEWHDLYLVERDNIEYNLDHFLSRRYLEQIKQFDTWNI